MKHILFSLLCALCPLSLFGQGYVVANWKGPVDVKHPGGDRHPVRVKEPLWDKTAIFVNEGDFLLVQKKDENDYISVGATDGKTLKELDKRTPFNFRKRFFSAFYGVSYAESPNAARKGDDTIPSFLYATQTGLSFRSDFRISFELVRNGAVLDGVAHGGESVSFRIVNEEPYPLFVSILAIDKNGDVTDCLDFWKGMILVPASGTIDLSGYSQMDVDEPYGIYRICLYASEEEFNPDTLIEGIHNEKESARNEIPVGYFETTLTLKP
jgi:hypothetical protein